MKILLITMTALLCACGHQEAEHHEAAAGAHAEKGATPAAHAAQAPDNRLRIDPEMLRDVRVTTAPAEARPSGEGVTALGELRVNEDAYAEVRTSLTAQVVDVLLALGEKAQAGQALVRVRSVELGRTRAEYLRARAHRDLANQVLTRKRELAAERIVPRRELQEAEADAHAATADMAAAEAALQALGVAEDESAGAADKAVLRSPIAGTVIDRQAVRGQMAEPATALFRIADLSRLWLVVHVFERDAVRLATGGTARVTFAALPGRTFTGTVALIGKQVEVSSRTIPVRIEIGNDDDRLRPGMSASAWMALADSGGPIVALPAAALQRLGESWCVFLPRAEGEFEIRRVGRGRDLGGEVELVNGLAAGETVVVDGAFLLKAEAERASGTGEQHEH